MQDTNEETFIGILMQDAIASIERNANNNKQVGRRDLVRTLLATCEGLVWAFREHLKDSAVTLGKLKPMERAALSEEIYLVTEQGKINAQRRFITLSSALRLCVRITMRLDAEIESPFGDHGWRDFKEFVDLRNRLTHPKTLDDLDISADDSSLCLSAFFWLLELVTKSIESANLALITYRDDMRLLLARLKAGDPKMLAEYEAVARWLQDNDPD